MTRTDLMASSIEGFRGEPAVILCAVSGVKEIEQHSLLVQLRQARAAYYQARDAQVEADNAWIQALDACCAAGFNPLDYPYHDP